MPRGPHASLDCNTQHAARPFLLAGVILSMLFAAGCDDRSSDIPPPPPPQSPALVVRPTTQQILEAPRKPLPLLTFPLIMMVPDVPKADRLSPEWKIPLTNQTGTGLSVEGPAPGGDVVIQLVPLPGQHTLVGAKIAEDAARKEMASNSKSVLVVDARSVGPVRLVEKRPLLHSPESMQVFDKPGSLRGETERRLVPATDFVDWTIRVFYPSGKDVYSEGSLNFTGLTKEQYDKDKDFLQQLVNSLRYDASHADLP